jgi:benzoyl-CoA reductase/2-hydroxyglutaryl-CoA dehydratase subunit BcrC/BadD/HgdB
VSQAIQKCQDFLAQVNSIVGAETDEWAKDFQKVLAELERRSKENEDNSF